MRTHVYRAHRRNPPCDQIKIGRGTAKRKVDNTLSPRASVEVILEGFLPAAVVQLVDSAHSNNKKKFRVHDRIVLYNIRNWFLISLFLMCSHESQVRASTDWTQVCSSCSCLWENGKKKADCRNKANSISDFQNISDEIEIIVLAKNSIYNLQKDEFKNLKLHNLKQIFLQENIIAKIDKDAFQGLRNLDTLDLSNNRLENIDPSVFEPLINLQDLRLTGNSLQFSAFFPKLSFLRRLDMSSCNLSNLQPGIFENLETITHLQLNNNRFRQLAVDVLQPLYNLKELSLFANPWGCDCHTRELFRWTQKRKLALTTTCDNLDWKNTRWESMQDVDFVCKPNINLFHVYLTGELHQGPIISVDRGNDITIECQVEADPNPEISWFRGDEELFTSDKYLVITSGSSVKSSNLTIKDISGNDQGAFTCRGFHISGTVENKAERSVEVSVGGVVIGGASVGRRSSKTWLWILLGILGFFLLLALIVLLVFFCLRRRRYRRKTHDQSDFRVEKKEPIGDQVDATTIPLIEKPAPTMVETIVPLRAEPEPSESNYAEVRSMTPMPQNGYATSIYGYNPGPGPLTKTYLSNSQVYLPRELHYNPGGYATYDPRRVPNNPIEINFRQPPNPYGRLYSPFSGSVASFSSEPPARVPHGLGYVTLPRRRRVPSWSPAYGAYPKTHVPPSPTGSLPPVPNLRTRYQPLGPRFDSIGPRTTADGGSNLSLNKVGLMQTPQTPVKTPSGYLTPGTPATPSSARLPRTYTPITPSSGRIPKSSTSLQNYKGIPGTHFNFDPIEENDGPMTPTLSERPLLFPQTNSIPTSGAGQDYQQKIPPAPPAKPKRKSQNLEDQNIQDISTIVGTEV
ncbi:unnamed protein product [Allacma fusca]|uniref:Ig-like domain-containing protein n=1 Tax=Allacma fusca TaxID=39272 RepID=A0A8J2LG40_9HEXA|nr:unnamed protein product [Allacma fusca]